MDKQTINAIGNVMSYYSTPVGTGPLIQNYSEGVTIQHNLMQKVLDRVSGQISLKLTALHRAA
jgi:hypothetical protein